MTINEVCKLFDIQADTLRYYERIGALPPIHRSPGGIRDFTEDDLEWVKNAICMRKSGVSLDTLIKYVRLSQAGPESFAERRQLLIEARSQIEESISRQQEELKRLDFKISCFDSALSTGVLSFKQDRKDVL